MEDLISRQAVLDLINADWKYEGLELSVNELPSVTPTHGTCKDCRNACESHYNKCIYCSLIEHNCNEDFYCKEFKKRGNEK